MYAQITPPASRVGYAVCRILCLKLHSAGSFGMSTQVPFTSNFQPWYTQRSPPSSLRPKNSEAPRCGQYRARRPTCPLVLRKAIRSEDDCVFNHVGQFPDISWPVVTCEFLQGLVGYLRE